jgi:Carboxypeptidase regulatory-like domain
MGTLKKWLLLMSMVAALPAAAEDVSVPHPQLGTISGTVLDINGAVVPGATATLEGSIPSEEQITTANDSAAFEFHDAKLGVPYHVRVTASGFDEWNSPTIVLTPDQSVFFMSDVKLRLTGTETSITVYPSTPKIAAEQVHLEEQQRVLGVIPNFYVVYDSQNAVPLTAKLKFQLAMKVSVDPVTLMAVPLMAGIRQAAGTPNYGGGAKGYGERVGAEAAAGFSDIMIGGAILPSLLHQDPRYFYQGTGTTRSRLGHALTSPFVCRGDNGRLQPNYSSIGGDLASAALMNTYYPQSNRGAGLVVGQFAVGTAERELSAVLQEFVLPRMTRGFKKQK